MARGPEIGAKQPARDLTLGDAVNLDGVVLCPTPPGLTFDLVDQGLAKRETPFSGQSADCQPLEVGKCARKVHASKLDTVSNDVNIGRIGLFVEQWDVWGMDGYVDCYPKRPLFREWVAAAKKKLGATNNADVAKEVLKVPATTLNKWLGKSMTHYPNTDALRALGDFLGRDYRLLLDEPGIAPAGISEEAWAEASDRDRVLASAMLEDLRSIPEEEKDAYYQLWKQGVMIGRARMAAEEKAKKASEGKGGKKP